MSYLYAFGARIDSTELSQLNFNGVTYNILVDGKELILVIDNPLLWDDFQSKVTLRKLGGLKKRLRELFGESLWNDERFTIHRYQGTPQYSNNDE